MEELLFFSVKDLDWDGIVVVVVFEGDLSGNIFSGGRGGD